MIYISPLTQVTTELFQTAQKHFPQTYIQTLSSKPTFQQSLVGRFLINQYITSNYWIKYLPRPSRDHNNIHRSLSHKENYVIIAISNKPIGIDLEIIYPRIPKFLDKFSPQEYAILGEKNLTNFYHIRTAKEAYFKKKKLNSLEQLYDISFLDIHPQIHTQQQNNFIWSYTKNTP